MLKLTLQCYVNRLYKKGILKKRNRTVYAVRLLCWHYLFSRSVTRQLSSAQVSLTSVFGMGTGGPSPQSTPTIQEMYPENWTLNELCNVFDFATEPASSCRSSFRLISISQLNVLPHLHPWPINVIVYDVPQWRSYLRESFTLRCLQRLSRPYVATQPCPWQDNWYTRGMSIPVLSY